MKITEFLFFCAQISFFCLLLHKKFKIRLKIKNINKNIDRLYKIVYYIVKSALCIVWDSTKKVGAGCLWKSYVISCKFRKVLYHLDTACIWTENMDRAKKRASPDQLLPYHKKISAEGKAQMICFISYTYMVLKRAPIHPQCGANRRSMYITIFNFICYNCMVFKTSAFFD